MPIRLNAINIICHLFFFPAFLFYFILSCNSSSRLVEKGWIEIVKIRETGHGNALIALNYFDQTLIKDPLNHNALHGKGVILGMNDPYIHGAWYLRKAIQIFPANVNMYLDLEKIFLKMGKVKKAIKIIEEGVKFNPDSYELYIERADLFFNTGLIERAVANLQVALKKRPNHYLSYYIQAKYAFVKKKNLNAEKFIKLAIEENADSSKINNLFLKIYLYNIRNIMTYNGIYSKKNVKNKNANKKKIIISKDLLKKPDEIEKILYLFLEIRARIDNFKNNLAKSQANYALIKEINLLENDFKKFSHSGN